MMRLISEKSNNSKVPIVTLKVCDKQSTPCSKELALPEWRG